MDLLHVGAAGWGWQQWEFLDFQEVFVVLSIIPSRVLCQGGTRCLRHLFLLN